MRIIADSVLDNGGVLAANSTIKFRPETAVLGLAVGDEIVVDAGGFDAPARRVPRGDRRYAAVPERTVVADDVEFGVRFVLRAWSEFTAEPMWRTQRLTLVPVSAAR